MREIILTWFISLCFIKSVFALDVNFEKDSKLPLVYLNVVIKTGAVDDPRGKSGLTYFLGQMLLRGTKSESKEQIDLALDQMGAVLEVETRAEALILRGSVLSSKLSEFLKLLKSILTQPTFHEREIKKLKSEVISKILEELSSDRTLVLRRATKFLFQDHPYGKPILGITKEVETFSTEDIFSHYNKHINHGKMSIIGAGDTDLSIIDTWAKGFRNSIKESGNSFLVFKPKDIVTKKFYFIDKPDRTQTQIYGGQIGILMTDKNYFPLYLANYAFGGPSFTTKMMEEIRVKRGWSYGANSFFRMGKQPRSWQFNLYPKIKDAPDALVYTLNMIKDFREKGLTPEEFERTQKSIINNSGFMFNTPQKRVENLLLEKTLDLPSGFMTRYREEVSKLTLNQVNQAIKNFLKPDQLVVTVLGTAKDLKEPIVKALGISENEMQVIPYTQE